MQQQLERRHIMLVDAMAQPPIHQRVDWTQIPEGCRQLIVRRMDSTTRAAWRTVCKLTRQDVHASTHGLTWRSKHDKQLDSIPLPTSSAWDWSPTTLPLGLIASLPSLHQLNCSDMELSSIQGVPATLQSLTLSSHGITQSLMPLQRCTSLRRFTFIQWDWGDGLVESLTPVGVGTHMRSGRDPVELSVGFSTGLREGRKLANSCRSPDATTLSASNMPVGHDGCEHAPSAARA